MTAAPDTAPQGAVLCPRFVTQAEASRLLRVSAEVLRTAWQKGEIGRYGPPSGAKVMYDLGELLTWYARPHRTENRTNQPRKYNRPAGLPGSNRRW